jgi:hypothetical protein
LRQAASELRQAREATTIERAADQPVHTSNGNGKPG